MTFRDAHRVARAVLTSTRRYPNALVDWLIWNRTGWPGFLRGDAEAALRQQLTDWKATDHEGAVLE